MRFLLDTNICIYVIKQKPLRVKERLQTIESGEIGISIITLAELEYGAAKSQNPQGNRETFIVQSSKHSKLSKVMRSLKTKTQMRTKPKRKF